MNQTIDQWIDKNKETIIASLQELLKYRSVNEGASEKDAPFGRTIEECLEYYLGLAESMGFATKNVDGYAGCVDCGSGEQTMGIMCHLDVVPEGKGWTHPPFGGEIADGRIYGRGTLDDKGPAIAALYALKAIRECGIELDKKVRIIAGCNEETGMKCLKYYKEHEPIPDFSISPDGRFPMTSSEKSMVFGKYRADFSSKISIKGGSAHNTIPGEAEAFVPFPKAAVEKAVFAFTESDRKRSEGNAFMMEYPFGFTLTEKDGGTHILCTGLQSHAANPHEGRNALQALMNMIALLPLEGDDAEYLGKLMKYLRMDTYGEQFDLDVEDESGRLTMNVGVLDWNEKGYVLDLDVRAPIVCITEEEVRTKMKTCMANAGEEEIYFDYDMGYSIPDDSEFVQTVLGVFRERTGLKDALPHHIGGGTYSRMFPMAVSFGPERYMCESLDHSIDEFIGVDQLIFNVKIIADVILAFCRKKTEDK